MPRRTPQRVYRTSLDRAGHALGAGGLMGAAPVALLGAISGSFDVAGLVGLSLVGGVVSMIAIALIAGPLWMAIDARRRGGPRAALMLGGGLGLLLAVAAQTEGFDIGLDSAAAAPFRWLSALFTALPFAGYSALVGWIMQRVAYRSGEPLDLR